MVVTQFGLFNEPLFFGNALTQLTPLSVHFSGPFACLAHLLLQLSDALLQLRPVVGQLLDVVFVFGYLQPLHVEQLPLGGQLGGQRDDVRLPVGRQLLFGGELLQPLQFAVLLADDQLAFIDFDVTLASIVRFDLQRLACGLQFGGLLPQ